jgi:hypothetical protein
MYSSTGRPAQVSADPFAVDVDHGGAGTVVGNALAYALVRPGSVVVRLVLGQDSTQMSLAEDQHASQELSAQGADYAFTDRVHARHPAGRRILAPVAWKTAPDEEVKSGPRSQITNLMSSNRWSRVRACGLLESLLAGGIRDDAAEVHPAGALLDEHQDVQSAEQHGVCVHEVDARIPAAWACRYCRQVGSGRRGAGSMPAARMITHTADGATATPSFASSRRAGSAPAGHLSAARHLAGRLHGAAEAGQVHGGGRDPLLSAAQ